MKVRIGILFLALLALYCGWSCKTATVTQEKNSYINTAEDRGYFRLMFYNAENLFDIYNDSLKADEEFLPDGDKHWTQNRFNEKIYNICKVIVGVGGWEPPDIVGLCEVENRFVLEELIGKTQLSNLDYQIVHHESPDNRGIDVGLLYMKGRFMLISERAIRVEFPFEGNRPTRDILYVKGETYEQDTLHIFINHWPSRWGGQMETEEKRIYVASFLRQKVDSVLETNSDANIIIMGDLNDYIDNKSITESLGALMTYDNVSTKELYDLSGKIQERQGIGTHNYQGEWGVLDHIIVSGALLDKTNRVHTSSEDAHIYNAPFLLEQDDNNIGFKPNRTYVGFAFHGGFSDHLPVYLDLRK